MLRGVGSCSYRMGFDCRSSLKYWPLASLLGRESALSTRSVPHSQLKCRDRQTTTSALWLFLRTTQCAAVTGTQGSRLATFDGRPLTACVKHGHNFHPLWCLSVQQDVIASGD